MKHRHVEAGRGNQTKLGDKKSVAQIFGGVGDEEQTSRGNRDDKCAPGERLNSRGDATYRPVQRGKSEQPQINSKN